MRSQTRSGVWWSPWFLDVVVADVTAAAMDPWNAIGYRSPRACGQRDRARASAAMPSARSRPKRGRSLTGYRRARRARPWVPAAPEAPEVPLAPPGLAFVFAFGLVFVVCLGSWRRQGGGGESDELGETIVVLQIVGTNQDRGLRAWVREALRVAFADQRLPWRRDLHEQLVVAHQRDDLLATVERVLPNILRARTPCTAPSWSRRKSIVLSDVAICRPPCSRRVASLEVRQSPIQRHHFGVVVDVRFRGRVQ